MIKLNQGILIRIREKSGKNQAISYHIQNGNPEILFIMLCLRSHFPMCISVVCFVLSACEAMLLHVNFTINIFFNLFLLYKTTYMVVLHEMS